VAVRSSAARPRVASCVCVPACMWCASSVCSRECPRGFGHDANAISRLRCVVTAHGKAVVGSWRGVNGGGAAVARVSWGAHARTRVLASQGRGVAVPCAGCRHPGPVARRGSDGATTTAVWMSGATGSCTRAA
jgi:hypothetical protein